MNQPQNGTNSNGLSNNSSKNSSNGGLNGSDNTNGDDNLANYSLPRHFSSGQKDILRLIGQHLRHLGLDKTTEALIKESGCMLEHPIAVNFCSLIMNGEWEKAESALNSLIPIMEHENTNVTVS